MDELKKYEITWFNYIANGTEIIHILAEDEEKAKEAAVYVMKRFGGDKYDASDIESVIEVEDDDYITLEEAKEIYEKTKRK